MLEQLVLANKSENGDGQPVKLGALTNAAVAYAEAVTRTFLLCSLIREI